jgi:hypothetical protein
MNEWWRHSPEQLNQVSQSTATTVDRRFVVLAVSVAVIVAAIVVVIIAINGIYVVRPTGGSCGIYVINRFTGTVSHE